MKILRAQSNGQTFYGQLNGDKIKRIDGLPYDDITFTGEAADAMRAFIADNRQGKHGVHHYTPESYGLDVPTERERFARYTERFGIEPEATGPADGKLMDL